MFPLILALVFGFIMFTQALRLNVVLEAAAREGARRYALTNDASSARSTARQELSLGGIDPRKATIRAQGSQYDRQVSVSIPFPVYIPFVGGYNFTLTGNAVFHLEPNPSY